MIAALAERFERAHRRPRVLRGRPAHLLEPSRRDVMRAGKRGQDPSPLEQAHRPQVDLLVAAGRGVERALAAGVRRGVEVQAAEARAWSLGPELLVYGVARSG